MLSIRFTLIVSLFWFIHFLCVSRVAHHFLAFISSLIHIHFHSSLISMSPPVNRFIVNRFSMFLFSVSFWLSHTEYLKKCYTNAADVKKRSSSDRLSINWLIRQIFQIIYYRRRLVVFLSKNNEFSIIQNKNCDKIHYNTIPSFIENKIHRERKKWKKRQKIIVKRLCLLNLQMRLTSWCKNLNGIIRFMEIMAKSDFSYNLISFHIDIIKYAYVSLSKERKKVRCLVWIIMKIDSKHIRIKLCVIEWRKIIEREKKITNQNKTTKLIDWNVHLLCTAHRI